MTKRIKALLYVIASILIFNFGIVYLQSCKQDFINTPNNAVQFPPDIESIFNTPYTSSNITCTTPSCHGSGSNANGMDLTDWQKTMDGSQNGTMVIPYNGFWSHMVSFLNSDTNVAPVSVDSSVFSQFHKIDSSKVRQIINWINDGAKSKDGQVAFTNVSHNDKGFITNQTADLVAVIQQNEKRVIRLISVGGRPTPPPYLTNTDAPHYIQLSPDNNYFYVSLIQEGYIEKYDVTNYAQVGRMQAGLNPAHIEISSDGMSGYVTNFDQSGTERRVRKFSTSPLQVIDTLNDTKLTAPHGMAVSSDGQYLYVTSQIGEYIFKIRTGDFEIEVSAQIDITVPPNGNGTGNFKPYQCALSSDDSLLFVSCTAANQVRIYNTSDLSPVFVNPIITVGLNPLLLKFTNDGRYLFVCNRNNNSVSVINASTRTVQTTISGVGIQPHGVDFTSDGQFAIIACETQLGFDGHHPIIGSTKPGTSRIIQLSNFNLVQNKLEMGSFPAGIAIVK